jgi:hypothetical protein
VGVLTDTKTMSASATWRSTSVLKERLRPRHSLTTASRPGSRTGRRSLFQASMRGRETSTTATSMAGHLSAITAMDGPPT